jgi:hypothetical protein
MEKDRFVLQTNNPNFEEVHWMDCFSQQYKNTYFRFIHSSAYLTIVERTSPNEDDRNLLNDDSFVQMTLFGANL